MKFVTDLHLHSKYPRAVSQQMTIPNIAKWAKLKGISVMATADFTHLFWFDHLKNELEEAGNGLYRLKSTANGRQQTAVSGQQLTVSEVLKRRANLRSDGRPIVGITSRNLAEIALSCDEKALVIPAHIWTPWFSVFGSFSGFDSVEECFGDMEKYIFAIETGLSSDPLMNWQIEDLKNRAILSFSDAHSPLKIGREAVVFEADKISYDCIYDAIKRARESKSQSKSRS